MSTNKPSLQDRLAEAEAAHKAKIEEIERQWFKDAGIKEEDLYPPEERARRFNAVLGIMAFTPPLPLEKLKGKGRRSKEKFASTEELEARAKALTDQRDAQRAKVSQQRAEQEKELKSKRRKIKARVAALDRTLKDRG